MHTGLNLTIDIGNTSTNILLFDKDVVILRRKVKSLDVKLIERIVRKHKPVRSIICSVAKTPSAVRKFLSNNTAYLELNIDVGFPVKVNYKTPQSLGLDRLAGIIGAAKLFKGKSVLVIDLGTCIKYDFLTSKRAYIGGSISPGLRMRLSALHHYTEKLPLLEPENIRDFVGRSTKTSMLSGVQTGILAEMEGFISRYKKRYGSIKIILSGGDAGRFEGQLKIPIFAAPDLVCIGLNEILNFNAKN